MKHDPLKDEKPASQIAFFRALYPEITATLRIGHSPKEVHQRLVEDGVEVSYSLLRTYVSRIRREKLRLPLIGKSSHLPR